MTCSISTPTARLLDLATDPGASPYDRTTARMALGEMERLRRQLDPQTPIDTAQALSELAELDAELIGVAARVPAGEKHANTYSPAFPDTHQHLARVPGATPLAAHTQEPPSTPPEGLISGVSLEARARLLFGSQRNE